MAKMTIKFPEDVEESIEKLGKLTDAVMEKVLTAGAGVILPQVKENLGDVIGKTKFKSRSTGELKESLGASSVQIDRNGNANIKIGFREPRKKQTGSKEVTNAMIANTIEHGKHGQPPKPFMKPAIAKTRRKCREVMQKTLEEEIGKL